MFAYCFVEINVKFSLLILAVYLNKLNRLNIRRKSTSLSSRFPAIDCILSIIDVQLTGLFIAWRTCVLPCEFK